MNDVKVTFVDLESIVDFYTGGAFPKSLQGNYDEKYPFYKVGSLKHAKGVSLFLKRDEMTDTISEKHVKERRLSILPAGTIIFAKIGEAIKLNRRAVLAENACIDNNLIGVKPNDKGLVDNSYLLYWLRKQNFYQYANSTTVPALKKTVLEKLQFPLIPMEEQKKIAVVLDQAQSLIEKRKESIAKLDKLVQSVFLDMFGNPVVNSLKWDKCKLSEIGTLARGKSKHRPRNAPELLNGQYPLIQTGDVAKADLYIREYEQTYSELGLQQSKMWEKGTLCITIAANIAKTGILTFDSCFPDSVVGFIPNEKSNINYVQIWFLFLQKIIEDAAPESAQKNINLKILGNLDVSLPPIELQNKFAIIVNKIDREKQIMKQSLSQLEGYFQVLLQQAFKGELKVNTEITA